MTVVLQRLVAEAAVLAGGRHPCDVLGHLWIFAGGANCGCADGDCSVPVHQCTACDEFDYGDNAEAADVRARCAELQGSPLTASTPATADCAPRPAEPRAAWFPGRDGADFLEPAP